MDVEIVVAMIAGGAVVANTIVSAISAVIVRKLQTTVNENSDQLSKKFDETTQVMFVPGEKAAFEALTRLTLNEPTRVRVTRFNPRAIQRQKRYFSSVVSRINGSEFEGESYKKLERYNRLTSLNSNENKQSLIDQVTYFLDSGCDNLVIRVTADKNDFEVVICEGSEVAAFLFHDLGTQDVLHSSIITKDAQMFRKLRDLYEKLWNEDIVLEIDFSLGRKHVESQLNILKSLEPINKTGNLSPLEDIIHESNLKINACALIEAAHP